MRACLVHTHPGVFLVLRPAQGTGTGQNRTRSTDMRILLLLILKSRALTTITKHIALHKIMQQYSGTPGVKSYFPENPGGLAGLAL